MIWKGKGKNPVHTLWLAILFMWIGSGSMVTRHLVKSEYFFLFSVIGGIAIFLSMMFGWKTQKKIENSVSSFKEGKGKGLG